MTDRVIKTIVSADGRRRVLIVAHPNGHFSFAEERYSDEPCEMCWISVRRQMSTICDSEVSAEREARDRVEWLKER